MDLLNKGINTTSGRLYLLTEKTLERLEIQFVPPVITIQRGADFATIKVVGRNLPHYHYTSGETRMPLQLDFYADDIRRRDVIDKCRWLEALALIDGKKPAQRIKLVFGELFRDEMWLVTGVKYDYSLFDKQHGFLPRLGRVDLTLVLSNDRNITWKDVR